MKWTHAGDGFQQGSDWVPAERGTTCWTGLWVNSSDFCWRWGNCFLSVSLEPAEVWSGTNSVWVKKYPPPPNTHNRLAPIPTCLTSCKFCRFSVHFVSRDCVRFSTSRRRRRNRTATCGDPHADVLKAVQRGTWAYYRSGVDNADLRTETCDGRSTSGQREDTSTCYVGMTSAW